MRHNGTCDVESRAIEFANDSQREYGSGVVTPLGLEPRTNGLKVRCSAN